MAEPLTQDDIDGLISSHQRLVRAVRQWMKEYRIEFTEKDVLIP